MNNIIKIQDLYDTYNDSHFGYLGINLESKEVSLYSDDKRKGMGQLVYKLDPEDKDFYKEFFHNGNYKRLNFNDFSKKGQILVISTIKKQLQYSKKNDYQIENIEKILNVLEFTLEDDNLKQGIKYNPLTNSLSISNIQALLINNNTKEEEQKCLDSILFGIGEIKISTIILDEINNQVKIKVGFYEEILDIEEIKTCENKDKFIILSSNNYRKQKKGEVLEIIFNDLECREIDKNYQSIISHTYGPLLDFITDGKLRLARYNGGVSSFHKIMNQIIPDLLLSEELLDLIENGNLDEEVYKVLNIYIDEIIKNKKTDVKSSEEFLRKCVDLGAEINNIEYQELYRKRT